MSTPSSKSFQSIVRNSSTTVNHFYNNYSSNKLLFYILYKHYLKNNFLKLQSIVLFKLSVKMIKIVTHTKNLEYTLVT